MKGTLLTNIPSGDGKATVGVTRGFKNWFSTREAGLTVESTVSVTLTCGQSQKEISAAADAAGTMAESLAIDGAEQMGLHMDRFAHETSKGLGVPASAPRQVEEHEEPIRRSEKKYRRP